VAAHWPASVLAASAAALSEHISPNLMNSREPTDMQFYKLGSAVALEKLGYGALKNILGAGKEGLSYLTPEAKALLTGAGAGAGSGALVGGLADTPGGAAGGALAGAALGGGAGRLGEALSRRFGKAHEAARAFGSTASTRPATREELLEQILKTSSLLARGLASPTARAAGIGALGAGMGAGVSELAGYDPRVGAAVGGGIGALRGATWKDLGGLLERGGAGKATEAVERAGAGTAAKATPEAMGAQEFLFKAPMETIGPHQADIMARLPEFMQNPEAWQTFAKEKGLDVLTRA
jgi:hypothetical protein